MAVGALPAQVSYAWEDDKNKDNNKDGKKKDPAGPPVVKDKQPKPKDPPKDPPKKGKKPDEESGWLFFEACQSGLLVREYLKDPIEFWNSEYGFVFCHANSKNEYKYIF